MDDAFRIPAAHDRALGSDPCAGPDSRRCAVNGSQRDRPTEKRRLSRAALIGLLVLGVPTIGACTATRGMTHPTASSRTAGPSSNGAGDLTSSQQSAAMQVVQVFNGAEILCGSTETASALSALGFRAVAFGNDMPTAATTIEYPPSEVDLANRLHAVVPQALMRATTVGSVRLVLGANHVTAQGLDFTRVKPTCDAARQPGSTS